MNEPLRPLLISARQAAKLLSISERTLWTLTNEGKVSCVRIGSIKRYAVTELERFIAQSQSVNPIERRDQSSP